MTRKDYQSMVHMAAVLFLLLLLAACLPSRSTSSPTQDIQAIYTSAALTMQAQLTLEAGQTAVAQLTSQVDQATKMVVPPKQDTPTQPAPTSTAPAPTPLIVEPPAPPTSPPPTATPQTPCDRAEFVGDITVPPDTLLPAGSVFTKIWRVRNAGFCTWTPSYSLDFTGGTLIPVVTATFLPGNVSPGQTIDLSVSLSTPALPGVYQAGWMLRNADGRFFGVGPYGSDPLIVRISTFQPAYDRDFVYDLATNYCAGSWRSGAGLLACPGSPQDTNGSVLLFDSPTLEGRRSSEFGLWVRPNQQRNGWVTGTMPAYTVQMGDYFLAEIGCLQDSPSCDVIFELDYQIINGASGRLGRWREVYDGFTTLIDIDLSDLVGRSIYLVLTVYNNGQVRDANAIWLQPRVQQSYQQTDPALTWSRQGYSNRNSCDELRIFYTSANTAIAQAFDCRQDNRSLGRIALTSDEVSRLSSWVERLRYSEGQIYSATQDRPVNSYVYLRGTGSRVATNGDLRVMDGFAAQIFDTIVR
jgi:hypothetical protein